MAGWEHLVVRIAITKTKGIEGLPGVEVLETPTAALDALSADGWELVQGVGGADIRWLPWGMVTNVTTFYFALRRPRT